MWDERVRHGGTACLWLQLNSIGDCSAALPDLVLGSMPCPLFQHFISLSLASKLIVEQIKLGSDKNSDVIRALIRCCVIIGYWDELVLARTNRSFLPSPIAPQANKRIESECLRHSSPHLQSAWSKLQPSSYRSFPSIHFNAIQSTTDTVTIVKCQQLDNISMFPFYLRILCTSLVRSC